MKLRHEMILASAGSGKTYELTNRFVRLLAAGAAPERIVALTFTRKAAGEFFDEILKKLARAAGDADAARRLARDVGSPDVGPDRFLELLRAMIDAMPRLRLGTFDGFFARIAKNFPLELGLAGEFELLEAHDALIEQRRVLAGMFAHRRALSEAQQDFIEAFKLATFGQDEKRLGDKLARFIEAHQEAYLDAPAAELWGNPRRIWPDGEPWLEAARHRRDAVEALRRASSGHDWDDRRRDWWDRLLAELETWAPGAEPSTGLRNVIAALPDMTVVTMAAKKVEPSPELREALRAVARAVVGEELARRLVMTQGVHAVIRAYEEAYHESVRRAGRLSFADVQRLLLPDGPAGRMLDAAGAGRALIDYRLDAETDHWLLDEFQDTSFGQWSVLKNLIDEAVQDASGARSLFYVGDVKQAIYAWRGGDPRLFREIFDHYIAAAPGIIAERHLDCSWRSGPPVIGMVNAVFGAAATLADLFPGGATAEWNKEWREHRTAHADRDGQVALLHGADETERFETTLRLLQEIDPLPKGLSAAVLVQDNVTAATLADYLRRAGRLPAVAESDLHVCTDNPVGAAFLALVQAAAHPGDTVAQQHLRMSPLGAVLAVHGVATPENLTRDVLGSIAREGFAGTVQAWWPRLEKTLGGADAFTHLRVRQFLAAAGAFDAGGSRDPDEFADFMARYVVREADSPSVIRVMTIHKSKGLGFDLVILPDLEGQRINQARDGLAIERGPDHAVEWVLDFPPRTIVDCDPVLAAHQVAAEDAGCYEKLSLLYVAMTRAKRALYVVVKPPGKSSSRNFPRLLAATLGEGAREIAVGAGRFTGAYAEGNPDWHRDLAGPPTPAPDPGGSAWSRVPAGRRARRLPARRPSERPDGAIAAGALFAPDEAAATDFGRRVHRLLATVEWREAAEVAPDWSAAGDAGRQAGQVLAAPALAEVWRRREHATVWRERSFEAVIDGAWITGVFDRVIVESDATGRPVRADVYDFKTDADRSEALERHGEQLNLYREAAARLLGLSSSAVACHLVMTRSATLITIPEA